MNSCHFIENEKIYLTASLFFYKHRLYVEESSHVIQKVTLKNCFKYLKEYGWRRINKGWQRRLGNRKFCRYGVLDCGGDGDCLFHCISEALNNMNRSSMCVLDAANVRKMAARQITQDQFKIILDHYKIMDHMGEFDGYWEPNDIRNLEELQMEMMKPGDSFWGDHIMVQLIQKAFNINIVLLKGHDPFDETYSSGFETEDQCTIYPLIQDLSQHPQTLFLYYVHDWHFMLVGYFNEGQIHTLFETDQIPPELIKIYQRDCKMI